MSPVAAHSLTARGAGLLQCRTCGQLSRRPEASGQVDLLCPRCGARVVQSGKGIEITSALLLASAILYIPANLLPVMSVHMMGEGKPSTIIAGAVHLFDAGQWPLALIIFVASIVVPLLKLLVLTLLVVTILRRSAWCTRERALLYRIAEQVGRWSMVDVFVIAILTGLVQFGGIARIEANAGTFFFAAVVVLTMLAARTLDEHLLWENEGRHQEDLA